MKIRATYSFYLDFMLPRIDDTEAVGVQTTIDDCDAWISTWGAGQPLYPSEVDQTLSTYHIDLHPVVRPEISIRRDSKSRILDRISVVLEWDQNTPPVEDRSVTDSFLERAVFLANALLEHIRVSCSLVDIQKINRTWDSTKSQIEVIVPHTQSWFDASTGEGLPVFAGMNALGSAEGIRIGPVPSTTLAQLSTTLTAGGPPPLHLSLLMDADEALLALSLREATLFIASACETCANSYAKSAGMSNSRLTSIARTPNSTFATKYFELLPMDVCNRSLKMESVADFTLIDQAYYERNKLMHTGAFSDNFRQVNELARVRAATDWLKSARAAVAWMSGL
jgi:hypothetical protein